MTDKRKSPISHTFTRSEIKKAEHLFKEAIKTEFGEVWRISIDAEYKGKSVDVRSPKDFKAALWHLCKSAKGGGAKRAAGRIEVKDVNSLLRFILFYDVAGIINENKQIKN